MCDSRRPAETLPTGSGRDGLEAVLILGLIGLLLVQATLLAATLL
ncbi:MAG: hypothetical protein ACT6RD_12520 [Brevundimonas sp.]